MPKPVTEILTGMLIDETTTFNLQEVCYTCNVSVDIIIEMVEHGLAEPQQRTTQDWHFAPEALKRLIIALRLQQDLGVNIPGAALALDLLNELQTLRKQLTILEHQAVK
jgi:chaperone modulatory protein CbpM